VYEESFPSEAPYLCFRYKVIRVWQVPPETFLSAGLAILPLAPISAATEPELPGIVARMKARLEAEAPPAQKAELWTAASILMGLKYNDAVVEQVFREVAGMEESTTYQAIMRKGKLQEDRVILARLGERRFGAIPDSIRQRLENYNDLEVLRELIDRVGDATSWEALFEQP
jgi:hypothetical protein